MRRWVMLGMAAALAVACEQALQSPPGDAGSSDELDASDANDPWVVVPDGWAPPVPPPPDALPPPTFPCVDGGADASACPLPHSECVNADWLEYFDEGVCMDGGCSFTAKLRKCDYVSYTNERCVKGACYLPQITASKSTAPWIAIP